MSMLPAYLLVISQSTIDFQYLVRCVYDATLVIVDRLTKSVQFFPRETVDSLDALTKLNTLEIIKKKKLTYTWSNRDSWFISHFGGVYRRLWVLSVVRVGRPSIRRHVDRQRVEFSRITSCVCSNLQSQLE